jgi:uncharacterized repeat protein (TIGR03803 family)
MNSLDKNPAPDFNHAQELGHHATRAGNSTNKITDRTSMKAKLCSLIVAFLAMQTMATRAAYLSVLHSFGGTTDGAGAWGGLILSSNKIYGTTVSTVFSINTDGGGYAVLHNFDSHNSSDGYWCTADLTLIGDTLYGTTLNGGDMGGGTVFAMGTNGSGFRLLHNFEGGGTQIYPTAGLAVSSNVLFGTTTFFNDGENHTNFCTIYSITTNGNFNVIYTFDTNNLTASKLLLSGDTLYGTTSGADYNGGDFGGIVFSVKTNGSGFTVLHTFTGSPDGAFPYGGLVLTNGTLYGTTPLGGSEDQGTIFAVSTNGSNYAVLYNFNETNSNFAFDNDGTPRIMGELVVSGDTLYGTTQVGNMDFLSGNGTIFSIKTNGTDFNILHAFSGPPHEGMYPYAGIVLSGENLYGTTTLGNSNGVGDVFRLQLTAPQPNINGIVLNSTNTVTLSCSGGAGSYYFTLASSDLTVPMTNWTVISTNLADSSGLWQVTDPISFSSTYVCQTNLIYDGCGGFDPNCTSTNIIGTNVSCGDVLDSKMFYRLAVP